MAYIPDPTDPTQPTDSVIAETAAAEFRALKEYIATLTPLGAPVAKAWVEWNIDGSINASYNITSVAITGIGQYRIVIGSNSPSGFLTALVSAQDRAGPVMVGYSPVDGHTIDIISRDVSGAPTYSGGSYSAAFFWNA